jgi:hypothetical protein
MPFLSSKIQLRIEVSVRRERPRGGSAAEKRDENITGGEPAAALALRT